jgi:hypothetical protein
VRIPAFPVETNLSGTTQTNGACLGKGELEMFMRKSFCSVVLILLIAGTFGSASLAAATVGQDDNKRSTIKSTKRLHNTSPRRQVASTRKHGQRTIIFVGGKKSSQGAATKSNPTQAKTSNGTLNPQPIPPGKQRRPE